MTKILNFALKIKGGGRKGGTCEVLRPCHPPSQNLERAQIQQQTIPLFRFDKQPNILGGGLECNLTWRCPFVKVSTTSSGKKLHFDTLFRNF